MRRMSGQHYGNRALITKLVYSTERGSPPLEAGTCSERNVSVDRHSAVFIMARMMSC